MDAHYTDIRKRRCGHCGGEYLPPGAGNGMCSDSCWMAARGRQVSQGEQLGRAWGAAGDSGERRQARRAAYSRIRAESADEAALARYRAERAEQEAVIARAQARSRGQGVISRSSPGYGSPVDCEDCRKCGFTPAQSAEVHRKWKMLTGTGHALEAEGRL